MIEYITIILLINLYAMHLWNVKQVNELAKNQLELAKQTLTLAKHDDELLRLMGLVAGVEE